MQINSKLLFVQLNDFHAHGGHYYPELRLSYELFGLPLSIKNPVVLVCHALTGNSTVSGSKGWWNSLIGKDKLIPTERFTVVAFNIPGNGYHNAAEANYEHYRHLNVRDLATLFVLALQQLGVHQLFAAIGGSLGGGICWEIAATFPAFVRTIIPVASDWKASDWVLAHNIAQQQILLHSTKPLHDARMMAMLFYRSPASLKLKFNRSVNQGSSLYQVESWLLHHGDKLNERFTLDAYLLMNHYLSTLDVGSGRGGFEKVAAMLKANVVLVAIDSDLFFVADEIRETASMLEAAKCAVSYKEIVSVHGHDGFLIEFEQLSLLLQDVFSGESVAACWTESEICRTFQHCN